MASRSSKDVEVVVQAKHGTVMNLSKVLREMFEPADQFRFKTDTGMISQEFRITGTTFGVELFTLSDDPHHTSRFERRMEEFLDGETAGFPSPEDVSSGNCAGRAEGHR